ncbi:hypothetical protein HIM_04334 [Hirsutella minnesotensis 3608]|uniref:ADF-H domain-containing protein n=1 Tax=Hirsutella minnesotensis 3608 TaxID=1043627 RepID=A0A0F8A1J0_9HYPO|nr:hypothetical protein HIM_04334 [Hirsutella minnesotensis 3608]
MSLNGLDDSAIVEAHEAAASEPGGWFLLRYSDRDAVELHGRGNGGVVEMRNAVSEYQETSPLYGFLRYRRRNVVLKYLPEDCSRIIQARVAVHFNAVCERFSPYDTIFDITSASELKDTKLSSACSLHAASCSTSSSTSSLRRRRLMEIAEEEEEEQRASKRQSLEDLNGTRPRSSAGASIVVDPVALDSQLAASPEHSKFSAESTSEIPTFVGVDDRPPSSARSSDVDPSQPRPDLFSYATTPFGKPKVKLGPRPSLEAGSRPHTAGNFRPISSIPAGFKLFGKGIKKSKGVKNLRDPGAGSTQDDFGLDSAAAIPEESLRPHSSAADSAVGSHQTLDVIASPPATKKPTVSPEKARLMKAMQLRREKKKKMHLQASPSSKSSHEDELPKEEDGDAERPDVLKDAASPKRQARHCSEEPAVQDEPDCAVDAGAFEIHADQRSDLTHTDSRPASPLMTSSEADRSTKASSLSESTDETVQAKDEDAALFDSNDTSDTESQRGDKTARQSADEELMGSENAVNGENAAGKLEDSPAHNDAQQAQGAHSPKKSNILDEDVAPLVSSSAEAKSSVAVDVPSSRSDPVPPAGAPEECEAHHSSNPQATEPVPDAPISRKLSSEVSPTVENSHKVTESTSLPKEVENSTLEYNHQLITNDSNAPSAVLQPSPQLTSEAPTTQTLEIAEHVADDKVEAEIFSVSEKQPKQSDLIKPIQTNLAHHTRQRSHSETSFVADEALMEELHSATLQEAKPMLVARTPVSATFSTSSKERTTPNSQSSSHTVRTNSNHVRGNLIAPPTDVSQSSARSLSGGAAYLHQVTQQPQQAGNLAKKPNIGSSISQRIKALEKLSAASGDAGVPPGRERPSTTFFAVKKREPSKPPSVLERTHSLRRGNSLSRPGSKDSNSESGLNSRLGRSGSVTDRVSRFESPSDVVGRTSCSPRRGRPESVSVTARIVRDSSQTLQANLGTRKDPSEYSRLDLKQSPLLVDHHKPEPEVLHAAIEAAMRPPTGRLPTDEERGKAGKSHQSSLSLVKDFIKERRKSVTSGSGEATGAAAVLSRSPSRSPPVLQNDFANIASPTSEFSGDDGKSANGDKRLSRAGRFMRRLSNLSGPRSKTSSSNMQRTVAEEKKEPELARPATTGSPTIVSCMGDVNVQFPDTLLWKRRNLSLDSQGFLILSSIPAQSGRQAQGMKRFHLSEFRPPYIPDVEVQELPNSVVLDFTEGTSIQIACEDRAGQSNVLIILQEAHATRGSTYGL